MDWTGFVNMLSMVKMSSDGVVLVPASTHARLNWTERNREKAREEKQQQEKNELQRQAEKKEMWRKVGLNRAASAGRVAASRATLQAANRQARIEEGVREQHALAEKERRLQENREMYQAILKAKFRPVTADDPKARLMKSLMPSKPATPATASRKAQRPSSGAPSTRKSYVSYERMVLPDNCTPASSMPVANSTHARLEWSQANRQKAEEEKRIKEANEAFRQAEQRELNEKVGLNRQASAGKVAASREVLLQKNKEHRRQEAVLQQHALAEKERRLQDNREQYQAILRANFKPIPSGFETYSDPRLGRKVSYAHFT